MRILLTVLFLFVCVEGSAQTASEIYLFNLHESQGQITCSGGVNISNHKGYDNQPHFHPSKPIVFYSSFDENERSDIKQYDIETRSSKNLTTTSEREYSPTVTPDGKSISCIIQRDNDAQDLGQYPIGGGAAKTLLNNLVIGYHCWMSEQKLMLFVLGDEMTLQVVDLDSKIPVVIAKNIGRSLHRIPNQNAMSFVQKQEDSSWMIKRLDIDTLEVSDIVATIPQKEDLCWTPDGRILMSNGAQIFACNPKTKDSPQWNPIDIEGLKLTGITRLAMSRDGKRLAVVAEE